MEVQRDACIDGVGDDAGGVRRLLGRACYRRYRRMTWLFLFLCVSVLPTSTPLDFASHHHTLTYPQFIFPDGVAQSAYSIWNRLQFDEPMPTSTSHLIWGLTSCGRIAPSSGFCWEDDECKWRLFVV